MNKMSAFFFCVASVGYAQVAVGDWPQFQGPSRDGFSPETGIARAWPKSGPVVDWTVSVGEGFGGAAIRDGEVYILDRVRGKRDILRCLSLDSGRELWRYAYPAPGTVSYPGSRAIPTVTEHYVYTVGIMGDFYCLDRKTRQPVWHRNLVEDFMEGELPRWGISQAPSIHGDMVIVAAQSRNAGVVAFDRFDGRLVWRSQGIAGVGYVSPVLATLHGVDQAIMYGAPGRGQPGTVAGVSLENGSVLWRYTGWDCRIPIAYPTVLPDNRVFITGGYDAGSTLFQVTKGDDGFDTEEIFSTMEFGSQIHQPLLIDGVLYGNSNSNRQKDGMACLTLDGTLMWKTNSTRELPNFDFGNMICVDGLILNFDGRRGSLHLVEPSPNGYSELARAQIFNGNTMWAPMAYSQGKLVLRSQNEMKCLDLAGVGR